MPSRDWPQRKERRTDEVEFFHLAPIPRIQRVPGIVAERCVLSHAGSRFVGKSELVTFLGEILREFFPVMKWLAGAGEAVAIRIDAEDSLAADDALDAGFLGDFPVDQEIRRFDRKRVTGNPAEALDVV